MRVAAVHEFGHGTKRRLGNVRFLRRDTITVVDL
jgi:hypothetical protein